MSNIVNVGDSTGRVETAVPVALSQTQMESCPFSSPLRRKQKVMAAYTLSTDPAQALEKYLSTDAEVPAEPVYMLNDLSPLSRSTIPRQPGHCEGLR